MWLGPDKSILLRKEVDLAAAVALLLLDNAGCFPGFYDFRCEAIQLMAVIDDGLRSDGLLRLR